MRKLGLLIVLIFTIFTFVGCGKQSFPYSIVYRDDYNTGGNIDFEYQPQTHTIMFGGKNQVVQFYDKNIVKGWDEDGCRVGIKIIPPSEIDDYQSGYAILGEQKIVSDEFYAFNNENKPIAQFFPIVDEKNNNIEIKITWKEGLEEQIYHLIIKEGTIFGQKE